MSDSLDLPALIAALRRRGGDSTTIEVKSAREGCPSLGPTLCAFGNMPEGGLIILGLDEHNDFIPVGLSDVATLEQGVAGQAREAVTPPVACAFSTHSVDGADVLVVEVEGLPLMSRPARYRGYAYLRQSDGDYRMSDLEVAQIDARKAHRLHDIPRPDAEPVVGTKTDDLDTDLVAVYTDASRSASRRLASRTSEEILRMTGVVTSLGELSLAGLYALGAFPQGFRPALGVTAAVRAPSRGMRTRDLVHFTGPVSDLLEDAMQWIRRNLPTGMRYDEAGNGQDAPVLPLRAVRELIANALVHRNLDAATDTKRVEIRIVEDKLVITSPGGLEGVSEHQLGQPDGKSAVNPHLYDISRNLRTSNGARGIEGEGGGMREVQEAVAQAGLPPPAFRDFGTRFTAILSWRGPFETPAEPLLDDERYNVPAARRDSPIRSLEKVSRHAPVIWSALETPRSIASLRKTTGLSYRQVQWAVQRLLDEGFIEMVGGQGRRATVYRRISTL